MSEDDANLNEFRDRFEKLVEEFNIEKYVFIYDNPHIEEEKLAVLYRPQDIMEITRTLKTTHTQFLRQVMINVGEG